MNDYRLIRYCDHQGDPQVCAGCRYRKVCQLYEYNGSRGPECRTRVPACEYKGADAPLLLVDEVEGEASLVHPI